MDTKEKAKILGVSVQFEKEPPRTSYYSELQIDYTKAIQVAATIEELRAVMDRFKPFAFDAWKKARKLTWKEWKKGVKLSKIESMEAAEESNALVGDIIFPELIFKVSIFAIEYKVPFGVAFNRLADVGRIVWARDHFKFLDAPSRDAPSRDRH